MLNEYNILEWCGDYNTARYFDLMLHNPTVKDEDNCIHAAEFWVWIECYLAYLRHWTLIICICGTYTCVTAPTYFHTSFKPFSVKPLSFHPVPCTSFIAASVSLDAVQAASVQLELQDLLVKTGLKDRSRLLLGPFSCSTSLEARWCRHSGSPGPEPGPPKLLLDLKGGLLQVCIPMTWYSGSSHFLSPSTGRVCRGQVSTSAPG